MAACLTVATLALGLIALKAYEWLYRPGPIIVDPQATPFWGPHQLNAYYIVLTRMEDSGGQRLALRMVSAIVAFLVLCAPFFARLVPIFDRAWARRVARGVLFGAAFVGYMFSIRRSASPLPAVLISFIVGVVGSTAIAMLASRVQRGMQNRVIMGGVIVLIVAATLPGAVTRIDLSRLSQFDLIFIEHHFSITLGQADRLAAGHRLGELVSPTYGLLLHGLLASYDRAVHGMTMGQVILALQVLQLVYLGLCFAVFVRQARYNAVLCGLATLLVVPWYHFFSYGLLYPNQSAWRTLAFPVTLLSITLLHNSSRIYTSVAFGAIAGGCLLVNLESGIAATAGLLAALLYRMRVFGSDPRWRESIWIGPFLLGMSVTTLVFLVWWRLCLGYWLPASLITQIIGRLAAWSTGFGGLKYPGDVMPLALLAWSVFILVHFAVTARRELSALDGVRIGAAAIAVVWLPYYGNRAAFSNVSSYGVLYAIVAVDSARRLMVAYQGRRLRDLATVSAFALTAIVTVPSIGEIVRFNSHYFAVFRSTIGWVTWISPRLRPPPGTVQLSGILLSENAASELTTKSRSLVTKVLDSRVIFLTLHSYLIPKVSGLHAQLPVGDLVEFLSKRDYERLQNYVEATQPPVIYVDPTGRSQTSHPYFGFYAMLLHDIGRAYRVDGSIDGWEIWVRERRGF